MIERRFLKKAIQRTKILCATKEFDPSVDKYFNVEYNFGKIEGMVSDTTDFRTMNKWPGIIYWYVHRGTPSLFFSYITQNIKGDMFFKTNLQEEIRISSLMACSVEQMNPEFISAIVSSAILQEDIDPLPF